MDIFGGSADAGAPDLTATRSRSSDITPMIDRWLDSQSSPYVSQSNVRSSSTKTSLGSKSSTSSTLGKKQVRWASKLEDYDQYSQFNDMKSTKSKEAKPILSKSKRRTKYPPAPEPPTSRGPPPAPRPRRLPTPDLPEIGHGDFCSCCSESVLKMNAQSMSSSLRTYEGIC